MLVVGVGIGKVNIVAPVHEFHGGGAGFVGELPLILLLHNVSSVETQGVAAPVNNLGLSLLWLRFWRKLARAIKS